MSVFAAILVGALTGTATSALLSALAFVTEVRHGHEWIVFALAPAGWLTAKLFARADARAAHGIATILGEVHRPTAPIPFVMAPLIWFTTVLTHLCGGSAGREGSAVQMGGALADRVSGWFSIRSDRRRALLTAGLSAGFASAIGTPVAGAIFGLEVLGRGEWRVRALPFAILAAGAAVLIAHLLHAPHAHFAKVEFDWREPELAPVLLAAGLLFGVTARTFVFVTHAIAAGYERVGLKPPWASVFGGVTLSLLFFGLHATAYEGLGLDVIARALEGPTSFAVAPLKFAFTALTLGSGFKGGEFIPLVFIGTTLGSALASFAPSLPLAATGFAAVFGAAAKTPFASAVMAAELFGWKLFVPALFTCSVAYAVSGRRGIYGAPPTPRFER